MAGAVDPALVVGIKSQAEAPVTADDNGDSAPNGPIRRMRLGDMLVEAGKVTRADMERLVREARTRHARLGMFLVDCGALDEHVVWRMLALQRGWPLESPDRVRALMDMAAFSSVPRRFQEHAHVLVLNRADDVATLATTDPRLDTQAMAHLLHVSRVDVRVITPTDYRRLLSQVDLGMMSPQQETARPIVVTPGGGDLLHRDARGQEHIVALWDALLLEAIGERASDIHVERYADMNRIRIRVDGDLRDLKHHALSHDDALGLVNVVKVQAHLDIAEHRLPQGGRSRTTVGGRVFDLRVQSQPSLHGENLVIRLLPQTQRLLSIEELGFAPDLARSYRRILNSPQGLVLVVGPTGSGKSTTLYGGLQVLAADPTRKVITAEDPIEYSLDGVQQSQVRPELGFTFDQAMRVFVREDPDVILVGEIRDKETALEAIRASQTGHLVLSTLHCNDAVDAVQRLIDLDQHPNSISSELLAVFSQRLARRVCSHCRQEVTPDPALCAEVFPDGVPPDFKAFRGKGCAECGGHGTHGRVAVVEYLSAGPEIRRGISARHDVDTLREIAHEAGMVDLRTHALNSIQSGVMPMEELISLLPPERLAPWKPRKKIR